MPAQLTRMSQRPNLLLDLGRQRRDRVLRGHVAFAGERLAAGLLDQLHGLVAGAMSAMTMCTPSSASRLRERLPDAVRRAGDDGDLVLVAFGHVLPPARSRRAPGTPSPAG